MVEALTLRGNIPDVVGGQRLVLFDIDVDREPPSAVLGFLGGPRSGVRVEVYLGERVEIGDGTWHIDAISKRPEDASKHRFGYGAGRVTLTRT